MVTYDKSWNTGVFKGLLRDKGVPHCLGKEEGTRSGDTFSREKI